MLIAVAIGGPMCGAIATTVKTYYEVKSAKKSAVDADKNSEASYETLAPAVQELQAISEEEQEWANEMSEYAESLEDRIVRLEAYVEIISNQRNMPAPVPMVSASKREPASTSDMPPDIRKAARPIPQSLDKAKAYQQQRVKEKCPPGDPLCGALLE